MSTKWSPAQMPCQKGRRIIITGGNSGIGWEAAGALTRAGADNAGVMALPRREESVDSHEMQFATNVLGPYRLTALLMPALLRSTAPRVVTVASNTHKASPVPLTDLDSNGEYRPIRAYAKTKLANILFAKELQRRAGNLLLSVCCHPGAANTNLAAVTSLPMKLAIVAFYPLIQSAARGAEPTLMAATLDAPTLGGYYGPTGLLEVRGAPAEVKPAAFADDPAAGRALFVELERISGMAIEFVGATS